MAVALLMKVGVSFEASAAGVHNIYVLKKDQVRYRSTDNEIKISHNNDALSCT